MNATPIVLAIIGGAVTIAGAIVAVLPQMGRLRRLERIVALMKDVDDAEGRERLLKVRDRIIGRFEPAPEGYWTLVIGAWSLLVGFVISILGGVAISLRGGLWEGGLRLTGQILLTVGVTVFAVGTGLVLCGLVVGITTARARRRQRAEAERRASAMQEEKGEAEVA